jgi:xylitol oxidase
MGTGERPGGGGSNISRGDPISRAYRPRSVDELRAIVAAEPRIRVLGTRHSFNGIGESEALVSLAALPPDVTVGDGTVSFGAGMTYGELALALDEHGLALHNMASLPHISAGGAIATATHGSGDAHGNLATAVAALELVTSSGEVVTAARGDAGFDGLVVGLGALGAVTRLTLDVEPAYALRQHVFEELPWSALYERFDDVFAAGYSVSVFTHWAATAGQLWVKSRGAGPEDGFGARPARVERHPILGLDPVNCTAQLGRPGPWFDRLPHFRMGFTPSAGEELQSEFILPRAHAVAAIEALRPLAAAIGPVLLVSEIRTIASDRLWISPQHGRDSVGLHFTWANEPEPVTRAVARVEDALAPLEPRPHWGKLFLTAPRYERATDFAALAARLDPRGAFRNAWLEQYVL